MAVYFIARICQKLGDVRHLKNPGTTKVRTGTRKDEINELLSMQLVPL